MKAFIYASILYLIALDSYVVLQAIEQLTASGKG